MMKNLISVCILAKNEEANIHECIESVKGFADEIIVVDNDSTDNTRKIAKANGAKVVTSSSKKEAHNRNLYLNMAEFPWIFVIDADERASTEFGKVLKETIDKEKNDNVMAYNVPINHYFGDGKWSCFPVFRVFKSSEFIRYNEGGIHPTPVSSIKELGGEFGEIFYAINHLDALIKNRSPQKREKYIEKLKSEIISDDKQHDCYRLTNYLGVEYTVLGKYDLAEYNYRLTERHRADYRNFAKLNLSYNYMQQGKYNHVVDEIKEIIGENYNQIRMQWEKDKRSLIDYYMQQTKHNFQLDFLQRIFTLLAEVAVQADDIIAAKEWCLLAIEAWPFASQHYINLASLENDNAHLVQKAISLNLMLLHSIIFKPGYAPNIYKHQSCILSSAEYLLKRISENANDLAVL